jgi:hypothetical protein
MPPLAGVESAPPGEVQNGAPGVDVDAIMAAIRRSSPSAGSDGVPRTARHPELEEAACPDEPAEGEHNAFLYFNLRQVNQSYLKFLVELDLRPSRLDRLPVVGSMWDRLRRHLHSLSIFYVNKVTEPLIALQRQVAMVLNVLVRRDHERDAELRRLAERVAELEARLAALEKRN